MKPLKVLVTGASGFVGRHVINELISKDICVYAVTRERAKLKDLPDKVKIIELNLNNTDSNIFNNLGRPNILIHLAWSGLPNYNSLHHFDRELNIQYKFLQQMLEQGLKNLVVSGTCFEYGLQSGPLSEDSETKPVTSYGFAKDTLRKQLEFFKAINQFNLIWIRFFYLKGIGQSKSSILSQLEASVEKKSSKFNMSKGEQLRDYMEVKEASRYLVRMALMQNDIGVVNLCSGEPQSIRTIVEKCIKDNKWKIDLNLGYYPYVGYEPMAFWGDSSKMRKILNIDQSKHL